MIGGNDVSDGARYFAGAGTILISMQENSYISESGHFEFAFSATVWKVSLGVFSQFRKAGFMAQVLLAAIGIL